MREGCGDSYALVSQHVRPAREPVRGDSMLDHAVRPSSLLQEPIPRGPEPAWKRYGQFVHERTGGRLVLVSPERLGEMRCGARGLATHPLRGDGDLAPCRRMVEHLADSEGLDADRQQAAVVCAGEATTNVILHAGSGRMELVRNRGVLQIWVTDAGPGIPASQVPQAALLRGFSTRSASLGAGFNVMQEFADRVYLCSDGPGTTVVLEFLTARG